MKILTLLLIVTIAILIVGKLMFYSEPKETFADEDTHDEFN